MSFHSVHKILALVFLLFVGFDLMIADVVFPHCVEHIEVCRNDISLTFDQPGERAQVAMAEVTNQPELFSGQYSVESRDGCDHCCFGCCSHITSTTAFTFARPEVPPLVFAADRVPLVASLVQRLYRPPKSF